MYKELFDEQHKIIKFDMKRGGEKTQIPTGEYEPNILCQNCDNCIIGSLEDYARKVIYGGKVTVSMQNFRKDDGLEFTQVKELDYKKFKLFLLSLLWRASISSRPFFQEVSLGQKYEENVRSMLLKGDPGKQLTYPCVLISSRKFEIPTKTIMGPKRSKMEHITVYSFLINGMTYLFRIAENDSLDWIPEVALNEGGEMKVIHSTREQVEMQLKNALNLGKD
jgi:hypothetical protein